MIADGPYLSISTHLVQGPLLFYLHVPLTVAQILGEANTLHLLSLPILPVIVHLYGGLYLLPCHYCFSGDDTARGRWPFTVFVFGSCLFVTAVLA